MTNIPRSQLLDGQTMVLAAPTPTLAIANVTPQCATAWLATQQRNRHIQQRAMLGYRSDMLEGRWTFTADPIRFDTGGHLIDGQNRLTALAGISRRNFALPFTVVRGLPSDAQLAMDQGAKRSAGQQLQLLGRTSGAALSAGIRLALRWQDGMLFSDHRVTARLTNSHVIEWAEKHADLVDLAHSQLTTIRNIGLRPSAGLGFVLRLGLDLADEVTEFYTEMRDLTNLPAGSPTLTMAKRIQRVRSSTDLHLTDVDHLGFLVLTWNAWVNGRVLFRIQRPKGGWTTENFPHPEGV